MSDSCCPSYACFRLKLKGRHFPSDLIQGYEELFETVCFPPPLTDDLLELEAAAAAISENQAVRRSIIAIIG